MGLKGKFLFMLLYVGGLSESAKGWKCKNGENILDIYKCDSMTDCTDGSDESIDTCSGNRCPEGKFSCRSIQICIAIELLCDGFDDCPDGTDELPETCATGTTSDPLCPASEFTCRDGSRCLPRKYVCDGRMDCEGGSDENLEMCCNSKLDIGNQASPCSTSSPSTSTSSPGTSSPSTSTSSPSTSTSSPSTTSSSPSTSTLNLSDVPKKCLKKPCIKKCKRFWDILPQILNKKVKRKVVRKCSKKRASKRCLKCEALILKLGLSTTQVRPGGKRRKKRCDGKNRERKGCKVTEAPTLS